MGAAAATAWDAQPWWLHTNTTNITSTKPQAASTSRNGNTGTAAAAVARDATCLEQQVCFFIYFVFYFITLILFLSLLNMFTRQCEQRQLATHDHYNHHQHCFNQTPGHLNASKRQPGAAAATVAQEATGLEPQVCFFYLVFYFITLIFFSGSS